MCQVKVHVIMEKTTIQVLEKIFLKCTVTVQNNLKFSKIEKWIKLGLFRDPLKFRNVLFLFQNRIQCQKLCMKTHLVSANVF